LSPHFIARQVGLALSSVCRFSIAAMWARASQMAIAARLTA